MRRPYGIVKVGLAVAALLAPLNGALAGAGDHIRPTETVVITPSVDLGVEYRSNVYRKEADAIPAANARLSPGVTLSSETEQNTIKLGGSVTLRKFFFVGTGSASDVLSRTDRLSNLDRFNDFSANLGLDLFKRESVGLRLHDGVSLRNTSVDAEYADIPYTTRLSNGLDGAIRISPGEPLDLFLGGIWRYDDYHTSASRDPANVEFDNGRYNIRNSYGPQLGVEWSFFPRTAVVFDSSYLWYNWQQNLIASDGASIALADSRQFRFTTGLRGNLSKRAHLEALVGYGMAAYLESGDAAVNQVATVDVSGVDGLLFLFDGRYNIARGHELGVAYKKDFVDSFFTNYVAYHQIKTYYRGKFKRLIPEANYAFRIEKYAGGVNRTDTAHRFALGLGYEVEKWLTLNSGLWLQSRSNPDVPTIEYTDLGLQFLATFTY